MVHRRELKLLALIAAASLTACRRPPPKLDDSADAGPVDHLATNEIPEGTEKAFTLILPKASTVIYRVQGAVQIEADLSPEQLSNYVRKHVQPQKIIVGATMTTFDDAIVAATPETHLHVEVTLPPVHSLHRSLMNVRDVTRLPGPPKTTDADAWRQQGRNPDGTPLNPKQMF